MATVKRQIKGRVKLLDKYEMYQTVKLKACSLVETHFLGLVCYCGNFQLISLTYL